MQNKKITIAVALFLSCIALGAGIFVYQSRNNQVTDSSGDTNTDINYSPTTPEEQQETENNKEKVIQETENQTNNQPSTTTQSATKKVVEPVISYIGQASAGSEVQANGYVPGIIEAGGTCTLTLSKGSVKVIDSRTALDNAQDTSCGLLRIPRNQLSPGSWTAVLSYSSSKYSGFSEKVTREVK